MAEYIERKMALAVLAEEEKACDFDALDGLYIAEDCISKVPAAEVEPVKCGVWEKADTEYGPYLRCSRCHFDGFGAGSRYCPHCGAQMDEEVGG